MTEFWGSEKDQNISVCRLVEIAFQNLPMRRNTKLFCSRSLREAPFFGWRKLPWRMVEPHIAPNIVSNYITDQAIHHSVETCADGLSMHGLCSITELSAQFKFTEEIPAWTPLPHYQQLLESIVTNHGSGEHTHVHAFCTFTVCWWFGGYVKVEDKAGMLVPALPLCRVN